MGDAFLEGVENFPFSSVQTNSQTSSLASCRGAVSLPSRREKTLQCEAPLGFEQYHEPAGELPDEARTFARMIASLTEEAEAIGWYEQRITLEKDEQARAIMLDAQGEEFKHFGMDLEFLIRRSPRWRVALEKILFSDGDIVEAGERAEEAEEDA